MDFTLKTFTSLLEILKSRYKNFPQFKDFLSLNNLSNGESLNSAILLRHDVDLKPGNSLKTAEIEHFLGIQGTYYFRIIPESFDIRIIKKISELGHEIGYHYEDMDLMSGNTDKAYESFKRNLETFRKIYPVKTICMHGSPRSKFDNKEIWEKYDYRAHGIIGEPYYDINYKEVLYLTDTGRKWNGSSVSVRDKVDSGYNFNFKSTSDIINSINNLPDKIMLTFHPQRWNDGIYAWGKELVFQNIKNIVKRTFYVKRNSNNLFENH